AIGSGFGDGARAERAARAAAIVHHDLLPERGRHLVRDIARHHRGAAAGRKRNDQCDRTGGIVVGAGHAGQQRQAGERMRESPEHGSHRLYSTFNPSFFTSPLHFFSSLSISAAYSAGVEVSGSPPSLWICFCTSGRSTSLRSSMPRRSTISFGVPAGASRP